MGMNEGNVLGIFSFTKPNTAHDVEFADVLGLTLLVEWK